MVEDTLATGDNFEDLC
ncbi:hypothetical protein CAJAP_09221 [Camponotus japonicus]